MRTIGTAIAGLLATLVFLRFARFLIWLALRPGGWAVLAAGVLLAVSLKG